MDADLVELEAELVAGVAGGNELCPTWLGVGELASEDFDDITILKWPLEWLHLAINPEAIGVLSNVGVDGVGEVKRSGSFGEVVDIALRRKNEDAIAKEVD